ncbi:protein still life, isoforms C/SIF type 2 isoform X2 [Bradysia coprophila]|uniref:protein still life, isoforms C/SIF type 2 isoform X2 n=1 Tax=Bradysia coprophila TaxID=38358 RepID=UPI00187D7C21|nr:protein still life, isoforms C/SIF type 2 isoform X2 [Bradysia coprophila]
MCNPQCQIQALKQSSLESALTKHGSLDQLLQPSDAPKPLKAEKGYRLETTYHQINGQNLEITRKVPITTEKDFVVAKANKPSIDVNAARKKSLPKQHSQPQLPIRTSDLIELLNTHAGLNISNVSNEKPQPPPRVSSRQKSTASDLSQQTIQRSVKQHFQQPIQKQLSQPNGETSSEHFDRTQHQRLSSRSAGAASSSHHDEFSENRNSVLHQRHSSGPSDLGLHQTDISEWLLKLPHKRNSAVETKAQQSGSKGNVKELSDKKEELLAKSLKDELAEFLKRPLKRQSSGPTELSTFKNDIFDWLRSQNIPKKLPSLSKDEPTCRPTQVVDAPPVPLPRKRHSLGHNGNVKDDPSDWNHSLQYHEKSLQSQNSCLDISKDLREQPVERLRPDRQLRHSASEVVSSTAEKIITKLDKVSSKPKSVKPPKEKYQYIYKTLTTNGEHPENVLVKEEHRPRHRQTQRSATVTDMSTVNVKHKQRKSSSAERTSKSSSLPRCTDPMCPLLPICTDANCCAYECCNTSRSFERTNICSEQPICQESRCTDVCYKYRCNSLPRCMDSKCLCKPVNYQPNIIKHNSLPRCVYSHRSSSLSRNNSRGSLPRLSSKSKSHKHLTNGKLIKSASAASLSSRRRRNKTVHFGENLLREVCQNRKFIEPLEQKIPSGSAPLKANIQMLYNFVDGILSSLLDEDEDMLYLGAESEPERGALMMRPIHRCNRLRLQTIRRVVTEAAQLRGTLKLGNSRYRHRHWRGTAKECNERFLKKISDDDRMSLTTAVSDEEDGESVTMASPYKAKTTGTAAASFNCTGAVRKAGFLSVKKWLLRKKHQIELARKRGWKGYWVCLKGTTLLFYPCDSREGRQVESAPKHLIIVDGAIMQSIPEHPKRDYIFCLSTAFGDAYLFQAPCQVELENWVNSIHSACAAAFARHRGKTGTLHLLQEEIYRLEKAIESDHKLKHMAELQQSVVTDQDTRHQIQTQILQWEENLERLHCEQFRLRCYMASLQIGELPNPKSLLTHFSRPTKNTLNKLGVFTVSSFHAFICARSPSLLNNLLAGRGATKRRPPLLSRSNSGSSRRSMQMNSRDDPDKTYKVPLPDNTSSTVYLRDAMSVEEFLASACVRKNLNPMEHFVRVKKRREMEDSNYFVPHRNDLIDTYLHTHEMVEVCAKILYQVELSRNNLEQMWGFSVEAELIENADRQDELCCYVSRVEDKSVAMQNGIIKGDEIMVINGAIVSDLDMMYLESVLQEEQALCMMMRSSRTEPPELQKPSRVTDDMIDSLVCPPPPSDPPVMSEEMISGLIVPAPGWTKDIMYSPDVESSPAPSSSAEPHMMSLGNKQTSRTSSFEIENLLKTAEQVTGFCRSPQETRKSSPTGSVASSMSNTMLTPSRQLTDAEKLRKVILELVDTERAYVKHLNNLLEHYLEPLKRETFLSNAEITALFGNIQEIVTFQRQFLQNLDEALELEPDFHKFDHSSQFKNVLFSLGSAFLYYVNHFKLYSSFCASHSKAQKVLHPNEGNQALQEFLVSRNPKQQHSSTLESYLIKPIQRILKYPLLLQQLRNLTDPRCEEHLHLVEALKGMEKVAEHINEMQRIHEEYGAIFDHLFRQHQKACKQPIDLSPGMSSGDLLYYGGVEWLNISDFLGKIKKGLELHAMCFVFKSAVVFLCKERLRQKKKLMGVSSKNTQNEVEIIRYQVLIPVTEVQVRTSSAKDMDSHFLWELIHLRSQLQRRSEKVYVLSNSTADFRNAFLKTIRQIIRESVRNMSIPMKGLDNMSTLADMLPHHRGQSCNSQTLERPKQQIMIMQGSQTLGKTKKSKTAQRHSAGNIDYDNLPGSQESDDIPSQTQHTFRSRSKTVGDEPPPPPKRHYPSETEKDPGVKSEGEDDSQAGTSTLKRSLGRTPNHLTLSTTSTLSVGSTGSQARLIQSSHPPSHYQPVLMKDLGSPVWKPRDPISLGDAQSTTRKDESK